LNHSKYGIAAVMLLLCTFTLSNVAIAQKDSSQDEAAIHDYVLTMAKVQTYAAALRDYEAGGQKNEAIANECKGKIDDDKLSLIAKEKIIESSCPQMNAWIKQHGMATHDFLFIPMGLITAGFAQAAVEQGGKPPAFVNPVNLQFVKEHKAELEKMNLGADHDKESSSDK
jgi:hypothetical protein